MNYLKTLRSNKYFNNLVKFENKYSMGVALVFAVLAIMHLQMNFTLSKYVVSTPGVIVLLILAVSLLLQKSRLVMVLGLFVLYKIYHQARSAVGVFVNSAVQESVFRKLSSEKDKEKLYRAAMNVPKTLEEEIVGEVVPMIHTIPKPSNKIHGNFKPVLSELHGASEFKPVLSPFELPGVVNWTEQRLLAEKIKNNSILM